LGNWYIRHHILSTKLLYQGFLKESSHLVFQKVFSQYIIILLECILSVAYRWQKMALTIIYWFKVDYCFTIMSYDGHVYHLIYRWWLMPSILFNRTNIIHMATSVSRRLNMSYIMFKIVIAVFIITLFSWLYARVGFLLTRAKHLHKRIISRSGEIWAHKTNLTPPHFMEVHASVSNESERSCICELSQLKGIDLASFYDFEFWFRNCPDSVVFLFFIVLLYTLQRTLILTSKYLFGRRLFYIPSNKWKIKMNP